MRIGDARQSWNTPLPDSAPGSPSAERAHEAPPTCVSDGFCSYCGRCGEAGKLMKNEHE